MIVKFSMVTILKLILFLFSLSIFNMGGYIYAAAIIISLILSGSDFIRLDTKAAWLFLFSVSYFMFYTIHHGMAVTNILYYLVYPWTSYQVGLLFMQKTQDKRQFAGLVFVLISGLFLHGVLNAFEFLRIYGYSYVVDTTYRISVDFWRKEIVSVTASALFFVMALAWGIGYLFFGENKRIRLVALLTALISFGVNLIYKNRAATYVVIIIALICMWFAAKNKKKRGKLFSGAIIAVLVLVLIWMNDIFGIRSSIMDIGIIDRFSGDEAGRTDGWIEFLKTDWWAHPFGGMEWENFAHNLWLDIMLETGYIPTVAFTAFTFCSIGTVRKFYCNNMEGGLPYIMLLIGGVLACATEPVLSANPYFVYAIIAILGAMEGMNRNSIVLKEKSI